MKLNKKGMTLIEIIVAMVISSIIMLVAGSLILQSFGYFDKTDRADKDKLAVDKIADVVRNELVYTTDVRVETYANRPNKYDPEKKWHWISIDENGRILKDDQLLYAEDYYQNRKLKLDIRLYKNDYRLDLSFSFLDRNHKQVYKTTTTLELINIESTFLIDKTTHAQTNIPGENDYRIYYKSGDYSFINEEKPVAPEEPDGMGTVADQIACKKDSVNDKKEFEDGNYVVGDFAYIKDVNGKEVYYRCLQSDYYIESEVVGNSRMTWKKIDQYFSAKSPYFLYDIVRDPANVEDYYICVQTYLNIGSDGNLKNQDYWEKLSAPPTVKNDYCTIDIKDVTLSYPKSGLVAVKDDYSNVIQSALTDVNKAASGATNIFYRDKEGMYWQKQFDEYCIPGEKDRYGRYGWQKVQVDWHTQSTYKGSDIIWFMGHFYRWDDYFTPCTDGGFPAKFENGKWISNGSWFRVAPKYGDWYNVY